MAKQAILVYGNIASGKSTLCKLLQPSLPHVYVCMDELRLRMMDAHPDMHSMERERACERELMQLVADNDLILYETTARTQLYGRVAKMIPHRIMVYLDCPPQVCLLRFHQRKNRSILPEYAKRMNIQQHITHLRFEQSQMKKDLHLHSDEQTLDEMAQQVLFLIK